MQEKHAGVSLSRGQRELGMVIPPALLYVHHLKLPGDRLDYPVEHVDSGGVQSFPKPYIEEFLRGMNFVLLSEGKPQVAVVSRCSEIANWTLLILKAVLGSIITDTGIIILMNT